jgi:hypothetical protein
LSPRIGFNWDVNNDKQTQLRGGTGVFTGRVPFVWISNQASNNGVLFGSIFANSAATGIANYPFTTNPNSYVTSRTANATYNLAVTDRDFKFPQVWRTNLAVDQQLPGGIIATLEGFYTRDLNAVYLENVNLPGSESAPINRAAGPDNRPIFYSFGAPQTGANAGLVTLTANNRIYGAIPAAQGGNTAERPNITDAILLKNTNKGYSYAVTGQLQKSFDNGLYASLAYTYTDARSVNDGGSIAQSQWRDRQVSGDPNANVLSYTNFLQRHRVVAVGSYRREYLKNLGTTLSVFYAGAPQGRFSYVYGGDVNGDGAGGNNDLIYVPRNRSEIVLRDITFFSGTAQQFVYTADQQYSDLDAYIQQDKYLRDRRGSYAERNGGEFPWLHQVDMKLLQDVFVNEQNRHTLQLSLDVFNVGNLLNSDWGTVRATNRNSGILNFSGYTPQGQPAFTYPYLSAPTRTVNTDGSVSVTPGAPLLKTFRDNVTTLGSRWQLQVGVRYIFN